MKRFLTLFLAACLIGAMLGALPARAQTEVPPVVQIEDPFGDANFLGDDMVTPMDASSIADLGKIWFTNDAEKIYVHLQTELPRTSGTATGNTFEVFSNPDDAGTKCLRFLAAIPGGDMFMGGTLQGGPLVKLLDRCEPVGDSNVFGSGVEGELELGELPDGTGLVTMSFPRSHSPLLAPGGVLTAPHAVLSIAVGETSTAQAFATRMFDDTADGTDYAMQDETSGPAKKCPKKKAKKKKCPKPSGSPSPTATTSPSPSPTATAASEGPEDPSPRPQPEPSESGAAQRSSHESAGRPWLITRLWVAAMSWWESLLS